MRAESLYGLQRAEVNYRADPMVRFMHRYYSGVVTSDYENRVGCLLSDNPLRILLSKMTSQNYYCLSSSMVMRRT